MEDEDEARFEVTPTEPKTETTEERSARAEIKRSIREDNLDWAFTIALNNEDCLSEDARVKICKMLHFSCSLLRRRRTEHEQLRAALLALHWGVHRKMMDPHYGYTNTDNTNADSEETHHDDESVRSVSGRRERRFRSRE